MDEAGYHERSYFALPNGFAVLTRIERIDADGRPIANDRFNVSTTLDLGEAFTLPNIIRALLTANPGYYRIIAFLVTNRPTFQSSTPIRAQELQRFVDTGSDSLPPGVASLKYDTNAGYHCVALIYEFEKEESQQEAVFMPSPDQGRDQLKYAGIWAALGR